MERRTLLGRLNWQIGEVVATRPETARARSITLDLPGWMGHRAGQHVDVRLTAEDGYQAERSYSIASAPGEPLAITVELLEDGEVSPYLVDEVREGDRFEIRGPIGGYFVWDGSGEAPVLLIAGGSGVVPLMSMIRQRAKTGSRTPTRLPSSSRRSENVIYREELEEPADGLEVFHALTRSQPSGWTGYARRVDAELLGEVAWPAAEEPRAFVCGSAGWLASAAGGVGAMVYRRQWVAAGCW